MNSRALAGALVGGAAGALVLGGFVALGLVLDDRLTNVAPVIVLAIAGAYGGWLLGVIVFGAIRGGPIDEESTIDP